MLSRRAGLRPALRLSIGSYYPRFSPNNWSKELEGGSLINLVGIFCKSVLDYFIQDSISPTTQTLKTSPNDKYFDTDHLLADLKGRAVRGGAVTLSAQAIKFVLQMGSTMVLARLLTPADFGLIAMVAAFTGFVGLFKDAGLSMATIQREQITHKQVSTLFWINVGLSVLLMTITAAMAPMIAWFYGEPRLTWITLAFASTFVLGGLTVQHQALLRRQMQFKKLAVIEIVAMATSVVVAIVVSVLTRSYWALVCIPIGTTIIHVVGVWSASGWRPGLPQRGIGVKPMLKFGGNLTAFSMINHFARNADNILLGWYWGASPVGLYSKAYGLLLLPIRQISAPISGVATPALCRLQQDPANFRSTYCSALRSILFLSLPIISISIVLADVLVHVFLGEQWEDAAIVFRLLAIGALVQPICNTFGWFYIALDETGRMFRVGAAASAAYVIAFVIGLPFGVNGVALSWSICIWIIAPFLFMMAVKNASVCFIDVARAAAWPSLVASAAAIAAAVATMPLSQASALQQVIIGSSAGCFTSVSVALLNGDVRCALLLRWKQYKAGR